MQVSEEQFTEIQQNAWNGRLFCTGKLSGSNRLSSLDLFHSDCVCYRCCKSKSVRAQQVHFQIFVFLLQWLYMYTWYMKHGMYLPHLPEYNVHQLL